MSIIVPESNGIKICPYCNEEIKHGVKRCKHCGADVRSWFEKHPGYTLIGILLILGGLVNIIGGGEDSGRMNTENQVISTNADIEKNTQSDNGTDSAISRKENENRLDFNIDASFVGFGEIRSVVSSNLKDMEIGMYIYSESILDPTATETNGIDYKRWYASAVDISKKDQDLNEMSSDSISTQKIDGNGNNVANMVLFNNAVKNKSFSEAEINKLKRSQFYKDNALAMYAEAKNVFSKDKKVILEYRFSKADLTKQSFNYDTIILPDICKKNSYSDELVKNYEEVICKEEIVYDGK